VSQTEKTLTDQITGTPEGMRAWQEERVIFEITERICELMEQQNVSRSDLAARLGTTRGYISQLLNGTSNMTIRKICDVYLALGRQFHATDRPINVRNSVEQTVKAHAGITADCIATALSQIAGMGDVGLAA
jgi:transcriptional regulator with XRE-family HTH domain